LTSALLLKCIQVPRIENRPTTTIVAVQQAQSITVQDSHVLNVM
jgi:hypothetical protein